MRRHVLHITLVLALLGGGAACGGDDDDGGDGGGGDTVETGAWVADVCTAVGGWATGLQEVGSEISDSVTDPSDIEGARDAIVEVFDTAVESTDDMLAAVDEAGVPDVKDGPALARDFRDALSGAKDVFETARDEAENLPTDDPESFASAAGELSGSVEDGFAAVGEGLESLDEKYSSIDLESAFEDEPACAALE
jgi:hypothetical protein